MPTARLALLALLLLAGCGAPAGPGADAGSGQDAGGGQDAGAADAGRDAGALPDGGTSCERAFAARTADIALLDAARAELATLAPDGERRARVAAFVDAVARAGGTPLTSPGGARVAFFAVDPPVTRYSVAGTFNGWTPGKDLLSQVAGSNLYAVELTVPRTAAHEYKLVDGTRFYEDRRAQNAVWDGIDRGGVGELNALVYPELSPAQKGRLVAWRGVHSNALSDDRDVFIYLPPAYDAPGCPRLPLLVFHDGNESLTRAPFTVPADTLYAQSPERSAVLAFVALPSQAVRIAQYTFQTAGSRGDGYVTFLESELLPALTAAFRLCPSAADHGVAGASLGGLISSYAALKASGSFGFVGSQSGTYQWEGDALTARYHAASALPLRFYVDYGCPDDNCQPNQRFVAELKAKGYPVQDVPETGGQHEWPYWQRRLPGLLSTFRPDGLACH